MKMGPPRKIDALRRNKAHKRAKLAEWRKANPEKYAAQRLRNETARGRRYSRNPALYLLRSARNRARVFGVEFDIDENDLVVPETCPILGVKLGILTGYDAGASVDRVDNSKGYVKGNVRVISRKANRMKGDLSIADMERLIMYMRGEI